MMRTFEKFGSMENVRDKAAPWGDILTYLFYLYKERLYVEENLHGAGYNKNNA